MIYFEKDYLKISKQPGENYVFMQWLTPPTSDEFKLGMNQLLDAIKAASCGNVVSDTNKLGAISPEDQMWSATDWAKNAHEVGFKKLALVMPEDIFVEMSVNDTMDAVDKTMVAQYMYFGNKESAIEWVTG